jgi:hypothetical protein
MHIHRYVLYNLRVSLKSEGSFISTVKTLFPRTSRCKTQCIKMKKELTTSVSCTKGKLSKQKINFDIAIAIAIAVVEMLYSVRLQCV